jgi:hypothetical protein
VLGAAEILLVGLRLIRTQHIMIGRYCRPVGAVGCPRLTELSFAGQQEYRVRTTLSRATFRAHSTALPFVSWSGQPDWRASSSSEYSRLAVRDHLLSLRPVVPRPLPLIMIQATRGSTRCGRISGNSLGSGSARSSGCGWCVSVSSQVGNGARLTGSALPTVILNSPAVNASNTGRVYPPFGSNALDIVGLVIFAIGFFWETLADIQKVCHVALAQPTR